MGVFFSFYKRNQFLLEALCLLTLNFFLKGWFLSEGNLNEDESFSVYYSQLPVTKIITLLSRGNNPPLHEITLHYWIKLFGINEFSVRFPSLIFSCLSAVLIYVIGESFIIRGTGLIAALLFSFSTFSLFIAQEARTYNLVLFLACSSFFVFLNACREKGKVKWWVLLSLINSLLLYSHYLSAWVPIVQAITILVHANLRRKVLLPFLLHCLGIVLLFAPFLPVVLHRFLDSGVNGTWVQPVKSPEAFYNMLWSFSNAPLTTVAFLCVMGIAVVLLFVKRKETGYIKHNLLTVLLWVWLPLIVSFLLSFKVGFFLNRYMFFTSPAFYLSIASASLYAGEFIFKKYKWGLPAVCIVLLLCTFSLHSKGQKYGGSKKEVLPLAKKIKALNNEQATILICPEWFDKNLIYYYDRQLFTSYFTECDKPVVFNTPLKQRNIFMLHYKNGIPEATRLVYLNNAADFHAPGNGILTQLQANYSSDSVLHFDGKTDLYFFSKK